MNNIISFEEAKNRKTVNKAISLHQQKVVSLIKKQEKESELAKIQSKFIKEAMNFKFINQAVQAIFVVMDVSKMPNHFPPDPPAPLVA